MATDLFGITQQPNRRAKPPGSIPYLSHKTRFSTLLSLGFSPLTSRPHADDRAFSEASANEATAFVIQQDNDRVQFSQQQILPREMPSDLP